jgi:lipoic acid synthetase
MDTYHGLSKRRDEPSPLQNIDPCGYPGLAVTQLADRASGRLTGAGWRRCFRGWRRTLRHERRSAPDNAAGVKHRSGDRALAGKYAIKIVAERPRSRRGSAFAPVEPALQIEDPARAPSAHRVRGSIVSQHRRMLRQRHGDVLYHGRHLARRCPFCDVGHGRPLPLDTDEPANLAETIAALKLAYVVITSVDRDDLRDGGAGHFRDCIRKVREISPGTRIEVLVPDFRGRLERALEILSERPPDVMNHNLETVPRLYKQARPFRPCAFAPAAEFKRRSADTPPSPA